MKTRASSYSYNPAQQTLGFNYGNGVVASFLYDPNRQYLTNLSYTSGTQTLFSLKYYYQNDATNCTGGTTGSDGLINCISDLVDSGRTAAYTYDSLGRVVTAATNGSTAYPKWGLSWAYDRYANRLSQTVTAGSGYNNSLTFANPGGAQTNQPDGMCFDASGNILAQTNATCPPTAPTYSYDAANQMTSYQSGSGAGGYMYDDHGKRVKKCLPNCTSPTSSTVYIFSAGKDIAEYDNGAAPASPSREYIYSGGTLLSTLTSASTTYHHSDHLSVRVSTDVNGNKIGEQGHYPYGESWYSANTTTKFIFTSYERDSESGNDYAMGRFYLVALGRYCTADPVSGSPGDPQSWNRYVYVRDNPINMTDPSGFSWLSTFFKALLDLDPNIFNPLKSPISPSGSDNPWAELDNVLKPPTRLPGIDTKDWGFLSGGPGFGPEDDLYTFNVTAWGAFLPDTASNFKPWNRRSDVVKLLRGDNPCSQWFKTGTGSAADIISKVPILLANPAPGPSQGPDAWTSQGDPSDPIYVVPNGRFYSNSISGNPVGDSFEPGSYGAQMTILLHELAHKVNIIPPDGVLANGAPPNQSELNTTAVLNHCQGDILNSE